MDARPNLMCLKVRGREKAHRISRDQRRTLTSREVKRLGFIIPLTGAVGPTQFYKEIPFEDVLVFAQ